MKINGPLPSIGSAPDSGRARGPVAPQQKTGAGERVDISPPAAAMHGEAPVNAAKVAEIKQAIAEGRFQINPERIADGLLDSVRDLLGRAGKAA